MPITDEQAKLGQEALKALGAVGRFLREVIGTYPEDLVGYYLGGDWLKVRRAENLSRMIEELQHLLRARNVKPDSPSISIALPLLIAAADESRDELRSIWARLLAAAADPARAKSFRIQFIEVVKQMDPLDAAVLDATHRRQRVTAGLTNELAIESKMNRDEVEISLDNLARLGLVAANPARIFHISAFGREFLRAISD
jgi:Abortive infection alpha